MTAKDGEISYATRKQLALKAFGRTATYDAAISNWLAAQLSEPHPAYRAIGATLSQEMRYGENPHQQAGFYISSTSRPGVATATQLQGKQLSYNNINDTDAAFELASEFDAKSGEPTIAIVKHANPCGVARAPTLKQAYERALSCDSTSAFGGILAMNRELDRETAAEMIKIMTEVIIAPGASEEAREIIASKKNLRLLITGGMADAAEAGLSAKTVSGGMLVQSRDNGMITANDIKIVTKVAPTL